MHIFDGHSDIWADVAARRKKGEVGILKNYHLSKLQKGGIIGTVMAIWIEPEYGENPEKRFLQLLGYVSEEIVEMERENVPIKIVKNFCDIETAMKQGKVFSVIGIEGVSGIGDNVNFVSVLYQLGVRLIGLTWNEENLFATGVTSRNRDRGITELGREVINKIEELGILLDVSHLNEKSFWDLCQIAKKPFIASHSNAYSLCPVDRNLKDDQIKAIAVSGGVICINAWGGFVDVENPTVDKMADHIDHIINITGIDHVGLGFDLCDFLATDTIDAFASQGKEKVKGLESIDQTPNLINCLRDRGYSDRELEKIAYKNLLRVFKEILK